MTSQAPRAGDPILVFGAPRSGTTWLGKILDSHPDTLLRHEPDTIDPGSDYSFVPDEAPGEIVHAHLARLLTCRRLKTIGTRPVFAKAYLNAAQRWTRTACVYAFKGAERYLHPGFGRLSVPDFVSVSEARPVLKSVGLGRAGVWSHACPRARAILLVRHPCGHVASVMRGQQGGYLESRHPLGFVACAHAQRYGLTRAKLEDQPAEVRAAWRWAVLNERAIEQMRRPHIVVYEDLCADPIGVSRRMFAFCGLSWDPQTAAFIRDSVQGEGGFFETRRDPLTAANRWRTTFPEARRVLQTVAATRAAALFDLERDLAEL